MTSLDEVIGDFVFRLICAIHNFRPFVGKNVAFALDEYECPECVGLADAAAAAERERIQFAWWVGVDPFKPNGHHPDCCCHGCDPDDEPYGWPGAYITSANFCDHQAGRVCMTDCGHYECNNPPF